MMDDRNLPALLEISAARHSHLCPRQVLGVRIGLAGAAALGLAAPRREKKRLLVILESDGCFADGVEVAAAVSVGSRRLKVMDYGKVAATFVDVKTATAVRVAPQLDVRDRAWIHAPDERRHYFAQLVGYQLMPDAELLTIRPVTLRTPVAEIISRPGVRVNCALCGEEISNEREVWRQNAPLCQSCAGPAYYVVDGHETPAATLPAALCRQSTP